MSRAVRWVIDTAGSVTGTRFRLVMASSATATALIMPVPQVLQLVVAGIGLGIIAPACTKRVMSALPISLLGLTLM